MGPLTGVRVVEVASIGPGPFCGMMLSDMGAEIVSVERAGTPTNPADPLQRNRQRVVLDLKSEAGRDALLRLIDHADVVFEGYRPGVAERLGFGPEVCLARNPRLVFGRMTGWGQTGPLAHAAGHDINYIALSGALQAIGPRGGAPTPPLNLVGDFGGGGMLLAFGIVCALFEAQRSGKGQVVDAAMVEGSIALMAMFIGMQHRGLGVNAPGQSFLSGAAHYYGVYETRDGKYISIGPLEPQFYAELIVKVGLDPAVYADAGWMSAKGQDTSVWSSLRERLAEVFRQRTRDEWCALLEGSDVCFAPVLSLSEAPTHPHNRARAAFVDVAGYAQNAPVPRFSRTQPSAPQPATKQREQFEQLLARWRLDAADVQSVLNAASF